MKKEDIIWTAGLVDGEGCIRIHRVVHKSGILYGYRPSYALEVFVKMVHKPAIERLLKTYKIGKIYIARPGKNNKRVCRKWLLTNNNAFQFLKIIYPFLMVKKKEANLALRFEKVCRKEHLVGRDTPQKIIDKKEYFYQEIKKAKNYEWKI